MSTTVTTVKIPRPRTYEPDDLLSMRDAVAYELVDGKLVRRKMGAESSLIALQIAFLLKLFLQDKHLGLLFGADASYQCFRDAPKKLRRADVSFVASGRLPGDVAPKGHIPIAPDLAIEVVSPRDNAEEVEAKIQEYLQAGVRLVWVVYPGTRHVRVRRPAGTPAGPGVELTAADTITGEDVLPGFACKVSDLFQ